MLNGCTYHTTIHFLNSNDKGILQKIFINFMSALYMLVFYVERFLIVTVIETDI